MLRRGKVFRLIIAAFLLVLLNNSSGQSVYSKPDIIISLPKNIKWIGLRSNSNSSYAVGTGKDSLYLYDLKKGKLLGFNNRYITNTVSVSNNYIYLLFQGEVDSKKKKFLRYKIDGNLPEEISPDSSVLYTDYDFSRIDGEVYSLNLSFNEFYKQRGKYIKGFIQNLEGKEKLVEFQYLPNTFGRFPLPVFDVNEKIYLAVQDSFSVYVYSRDGKLVKSFLHPTFKNEPYTEKEIENLSGMARMSAIAGETFPPIIKNIETESRGRIYITRFLRPGSKNLMIDLFRKDGEFIKTEVIRFNNNEILHDFKLLSADRYTLIVSYKDKDEYEIFIYDLH